VENRGIPVKATMTVMEKAGYHVFLGETKAVDPMYRHVDPSTIRAAPDLPSALIGAARVVAVLDYANPGHVEAIKNCRATAPWFAGGKTGLVISHVVPLEPALPYRGMQGLHRLPSTVPSAVDLFDDERKVVRLLDAEDEAMFAALHREHKRRRRTVTTQTTRAVK
jgi:hypothetical protein